MFETTVAIQRPEGSTIASGIRVQVDLLSMREQIVMRQVSTWHSGDYFRIYTFDWNPTALIRRDDILIDQTHIDPDTISDTYPNGTYFKYRVVGRVKNFDFSHQECYAEVVVGG